MCRPFIFLLLASAFPALAFQMPKAGSNESIPVNAPGPERIYGTYTQGCIAGATPFEMSTEVWETVNPQRNHQYGHSSLILFAKELGRTAVDQGWGKITIGDSSCPAGMKMSAGHSSHRIGLDVDIFYRFVPVGQTLSFEERNAWSDAVQLQHEIVRYSVPYKGEGPVIAEPTPHFSSQFKELLKAAAQPAEVDRIFVSPPVKAELCAHFAEASAGKTAYPSWLKKFRAWSGHRSHFHVRLKCPKDSPLCKNQTPVWSDPSDSTGVGCAGDDFNSWFKQKNRPQPKPKPEPDPKPEDPEDPDEPSEPVKPAPKPETPEWLKKCEELEASMSIVQISEFQRCVYDHPAGGLPEALGEKELIQLRCRDYRSAQNFTRWSRCLPAETAKDVGRCLMPQPMDRKDR